MNPFAIIKNFQSLKKMDQLFKLYIIISERMDNTRDIPHSIIKSTIKINFHIYKFTRNTFLFPLFQYLKRSFKYHRAIITIPRKT